MEMITERLLLNEFEESDADTVARLAGDKKVVEMTISIPHPYTTNMAAKWIKSQQKQKNNNYVFAIRLKENKRIIGCVSIELDKKHDKGSLDYWIGYNFWGKGFGTEAVQEIIKFGFENKKLNRIWAAHFPDNIASKKVMEKAGMKHEGTMRSYFKRDKNYLDVSVRSILRSEYENFYCMTAPQE